MLQKLRHNYNTTRSEERCCLQGETSDESAKVNSEFQKPDTLKLNKPKKNREVVIVSFSVDAFYDNKFY